MRKVFLVTSVLVPVDVVLQFYFAGVGVFRRPVASDDFALHAANATVLQVVILLNVVAAAVARAGARTIVLAALPFVLIYVQIVIFILGDLFVPAGTPRDADGIPVVVQGAPSFVIAFHVVNGLVILTISVLVLRRARAHAAAVETRTPTAAV